MFDLKWIRDNPLEFDAQLARRGLAPLAQEITALEARRREQLTQAQNAQTQRNSLSKRIGQALARGDQAEAAALKAETLAIKAQAQDAQDAVRRIETDLRQRLEGIPNLPLSETPDGTDENDNIEIRRYGTEPSFDFSPKQHFDLGEALGLMDFATAARLAGARFVVLTGALARLERALAQFMLDLQTQEHGYEEVYVPYLVNQDVMYGTGQLPKFAHEQFCTTDGRWLIPTAEPPLTNLVREQIIDESRLPKRVVAYTPCFRAEAGAAGRDTRGMIRQHQFSKVELVSVTTPATSRAELDRMTACAEEVLKRLNLHYRVLALCTGDMGFGARLTFDIEVWLPGQNAFREISSCSVCGDFQARRMNARYRPKDGAAPQFVHTLNGSGLAVGRCLVAVMENYQRADGAIVVPEALRPYMGGLDLITAHE